MRTVPCAQSRAHSPWPVRTVSESPASCLFSQVFPEIYSTMPPKERVHFDKAVDAGFLGATVFYAVFAAAAYFFFGD